MARFPDIIEVLTKSNSGIFAVDEQLPALRRPLASPSVASSVELRRTFHELVMTAPGLSAKMAGLCMFEEALRQRDRTGVAAARVMANHGLLTGVRADTGEITLDEGSGRTVTDGLAGLEGRLDRFVQLGAHFASWHLVLGMTPQDRDGTRIHAENCLRAAFFAAAAQRAGLLPFIKLEIKLVALDAPETILESERRALELLMGTLRRQGVSMEALILKTSFASIAIQVETRASVEAIWSVLQAEIPRSLPGLFVDIETLRELDRVDTSSGRVGYVIGPRLQARMLSIWDGADTQREAMQNLLLTEAGACAAAVRRVNRRG